jgi:hypothetical protein
MPRQRSRRSQRSPLSRADPRSRHNRLQPPSFSLQPPWGTRRTVLRAVGVYLAVVVWLVAGAVPAVLLNMSPSLSIFVLVLWAGAGTAGIWIAGAWLGGGGRAARTLPWGLSFPIVLFLGVTIWVTAPEIVLLDRGQHVTAVVAGAVAQSGKGGLHYRYILRTMDGQPIAGELNTEDSSPQPLGSTFDVIMDPQGQAEPDFASSVRETAIGATAVAVLWALVLVGLVGRIAYKGEKRRHA